MRAAALLLAAVVAAAGAGATDAATASGGGKHHRHHSKRSGCPKDRCRALRDDRAPSTAHLPGPPVTEPPAGTPPPPKQLAHLQVAAREFTITPSRTSVAAGRVAVEFDNNGQDPHNLRVERTDDASTGFNFELAKPGVVSSKQLELGTGTWKLYCTLAGHDAAGMHATVTVGTP